jgi:hypothetical protein
MPPWQIYGADRALCSARAIHRVTNGKRRLRERTSTKRTAGTIDNISTFVVTITSPWRELVHS